MARKEAIIIGCIFTKGEYKDSNGCHFVLDVDNKEINGCTPYGKFLLKINFNNSKPLLEAGRKIAEFIEAWDNTVQTYQLTNENEPESV